MANISVYFGRTDALKYQKFLLMDMINQAEIDLQCLQENHEKQAALKRMINDSSDVWQPMSDILMPMNNVKRASTNVKYQTRLISFMKAKQQAVELLIENDTNPKVSDY